METGNIESSLYWENRYKEKTDSWSLHSPNPVFKDILEKPPFPFGKKMLIPGCGLGHDAALAASMGYEVTALDFASPAAEFARSLAATRGQEFRFLNRDVLEANEDLAGQFDIVYEYTLLCALPGEKTEMLLGSFARLLKPGGYFISVLFPVNEREGGPPFTVDPVRLHSLARQHFEMLFFTRNINSIKPRINKEVLFIFQKPLTRT